MLISHRYKFIFLKTEKTASTSLYEIFRKIILEHDPLHRAEWVVRKKLLREHGSLEGFSFEGKRGAMRRKFPRFSGIHHHGCARHGRAFLGPDLFDSYTIVTSERNPWDRQVFLFTHRQSKHPERNSTNFSKCMRSPVYRFFAYNRLHNWDVYTIDGKVCADHVIRFENLEEDFHSVLIALGLDAERYYLPHRRAQTRSNGPNYRDYYTDDVRVLVGKWYRDEIKHFGYEF
jgi:hypothetical protein